MNQRKQYCAYGNRNQYIDGKTCHCNTQSASCRRWMPHVQYCRYEYCGTDRKRIYYNRIDQSRVQYQRKQKTA